MPKMRNLGPVEAVNMISMISASFQQPSMHLEFLPNAIIHAVLDVFY